MLITRGAELGVERHSGDRSWVSRERQSCGLRRGLWLILPERPGSWAKAIAGVGSRPGGSRGRRLLSETRSGAKDRTWHRDMPRGARRPPLTGHLLGLVDGSFSLHHHQEKLLTARSKSPQARWGRCFIASQAVPVTGYIFNKNLRLAGKTWKAGEGIAAPWAWEVSGPASP